MIDYSNNYRYLTIEGETETLDNFLKSNGYLYEEDRDASLVFAKERIGNDSEVNNHKIKIMERVTKEEMDEIIDNVADRLSDMISDEISCDVINEMIDDEVDAMDLEDEEE